jgi:ribosomal protein L25 (general stress protein Ctc)
MIPIVAMGGGRSERNSDLKVKANIFGEKEEVFKIKVDNKTVWKDTQKEKDSQAVRGNQGVEIKSLIGNYVTICPQEGKKQ